MGNSRRAATRSLYKHVFKPVLFRFSPDGVHTSMLKLSDGLARMPFALTLGRWWFGADKTSQPVEVAGMVFKNPIGIAAGLDKNGELLPMASMIGCGFTTVGSLTLEPRKGNARPWFFRLPRTQSIVVHSGMANEGLRAARKRLEHRPKEVATIISIAVVAQQEGVSDERIIHEALTAASYVAQHHLAEAIELNVSCPNTGDNEPFTEPARLDQLLAACDAARIDLPVFLKLPNHAKWESFEPIIEVVLRHRVQGVTIANLVKDRSRVTLNDPLPDEVRGGLSGEPTRRSSVELIRRTRQLAGDRLAIIGVGGVFSVKDAQEKLDAGADAVALVSGLIFEGPQLVGDIVSKLRAPTL